MIMRLAVATALVTLGITTNASAQQPTMQQHSAAPADSAKHAMAEHAASPEQGPHGGTLTAAGDMKIETAVEPGGIRLYAFDSAGQPLDLRNARGVASLQLKGVAKRYRYDLYPEVRKDQSAESLAVSVDLSRVTGQAGELTFQLVGLTGDRRRPTTFSTEFVGPQTEAQQTAAAIAKQKVCPVSGQPLGSMGDPIAVTKGDQTLYVCCAGCVQKAKANFATYLKKLEPQIVAAPATAADNEAIKLQKTCPVANQPLGSMGTPIKVTGLERDVYLCCQGCVNSLKSAPDKYLAKLPPLPVAKPTVVKATAADATYVAAQKLCPVMDEPLDAMGGPYKTVVEGQVVYLCCPGCAKMLAADPDKYLAKLKEQGVTPPVAE